MIWECRGTTDIWVRFILSSDPMASLEQPGAIWGFRNAPQFPQVPPVPCPWEDPGGPSCPLLDFLVVYWVEGVYDICCFVECSSWKLGVVAMSEPVIAVAVGDTCIRGDGEQLTALWSGLAALSR